ncbi:MAG: hypothetical protein J6E41_00240 [Lachnospiraceae bacterium]|nr:hypothetical protein [Lachnospiraceae bacterium]
MAIMESFTGAETEYGFSAVQIILLLELADAKNIFTYPLPEEENITDENYILAAQDLMARGFIENTAGEGRGNCGLRLTSKAMDLFESMIDPVCVVEVISAWTGVLPAAVYRGRGPFCTVSRWDSEGGYIGISRMDCSRIGEWLDVEGYLPEQPFESIREAQKSLQYDPLMEDNRFRVRKGLICHPQQPTALWALQENVRCAIRSYATSQTGTAAKTLMQTGAGAEPETGEETVILPTKTGSGALYVFLETDNESWILTDTGAGDSDLAYTFQDDDITGKETGNELIIEDERGDGAAADFRWALVPDSLEYRTKIWRTIL